MRIALLLLLTTLTACGPEPEVAALADWDPCGQGHPFRLERGAAQAKRAHQVSAWFGRDVHELSQPAPDRLGDTRDALVATVPSEIRAPVPASDEPRRLTTALLPVPQSGDRRTTGRSRIRAEVRSRSADGVQVLASVALDPAARAWQELRLELPPGPAGELLFRLRWEQTGALTPPETEVAWGSPVLAPATQAREGPPDVLLVTVDTFRADALEQAPELQELLSQGCLWTAAVAPSNWTLPAYASLLSGLDPAAHGAGRARGLDGAASQRDYRGLRPELPTLAEQFRSAGYATAMVHQNPFLEPWTGLDRGFEVYQRCREETGLALSLAGDWWRRNDHRPRFLVVHLMAPHLPYAPPGAGDLGPDPLAALDLEAFFSAEHSPAQRRRFFDLSEADRSQVARRYRAEVAALDRELGPWLRERLEATPAPLLAFHADHGEELWDDGSFEHGHSFHDAVVRVPAALVWPGKIDAERRAEAVGAHWMAPTLLRLAGLPRPDGWSRDLFDRRGSTTSSSTYYPAPRAGGRFDVATGRSEELGPAEAVAGTGPEAALSEELARALRELGY